MKLLTLLLLAVTAFAAPQYSVSVMPLIPSISGFAAPGIAGVTEVFVWDSDPSVIGFEVAIHSLDGTSFRQTVYIDPEQPSTMAWFPVVGLLGEPQITEIHASHTHGMLRRE